LTSAPANFRPHTIAEPTGAEAAAALTREDERERLESVRRLVAVGQGFLELGGDHGANYALAKLLIHLTDALATVGEPDGNKPRAAA
jgi:hypothetical protein